MSLDDITLAVDYFDLKKIAESGQCFRWKELGPGKYLIPSGQTCAIMEQKEPDDDLHLLIEEGTLPLWQDYLNYWSPAKKDDLVQRLGPYEDIGLEPAEIVKRLKDAEKAAEGRNA